MSGAEWTSCLVVIASSAAVAASLSEHALTLLAGGNNAITRPAVLALGIPLARVGLITLDAHFDMRDTDEGLSNGNPVRALIQDGLPGANIAQVGLASFANSKTMHEDALAAGNLVITIEEVRLSDTMGWGNPLQTKRMIGAVIEKIHALGVMLFMVAPASAGFDETAL